MSEFLHNRKLNPQIFRDLYTWRIFEFEPEPWITVIKSPQIPVQNMDSTFFLEATFQPEHKGQCVYINFSVNLRSDCDLQPWKTHTTNIEINGLRNNILGNNTCWKKTFKFSALSTIPNIKVATESCLWKSPLKNCETIDDLVLLIDITQTFDDTPKLGIEEPVKLCGDMEKLFNSTEFADVTIKVDEKVFKAHKCILVNRSAVFYTMLKTNMLESNTNEITIKDITAECFEELLFYIYTGRLRDLKNATIALASAAEMYEVFELSSFCESYLEQNISVETAVEMFKYSDFKNRKQLRDTAVDFIQKNKRQFSDETLKLIVNDPKFCEALLNKNWE